MSPGRGCLGRGPADLPPLWRRLLWFAGLWLLGVATVSLVGWLLRALFAPAG